ncbi:unnamed protein product [Sphagnum jensenii]
MHERMRGDLQGAAVQQQVQAGAEMIEKVPIPGLRPTVWDQTQQKVKYPKLLRKAVTDVVVVGAGIAGLTVAYNLAKEGKKVVVLESRVRAGGQTGRTSAHTMPWYDDFYHQVEDVHGLYVAQIVAEIYKTAIGWVERTVEEEGIQCNFARVDVYLFPHAHTKEAHDKLLKEFVACQNLGVKVEMQELGNDPASGKIGTAIQFANAAEFHPLLYINGLADAIVKKGGKIYEETRVMKCEGTKVTTEEAFQVTANALVITTNSPINHDLRAQWWDTADTYHYMRIEQRQDFDVLVVGGEDTSTGMKPRDFHDPYGNLAKWAKARWTSAEEVFEPANVFHIIGPEPLEAGKADQYVVTGDSGQGMTESTIAGIMIKDMILGKQNSWVKAYNPQRKLPISKQTLSNVAEEI